MKKAGHVFTSMKTRFFKLEEGADGYELKYYGKEGDAKEKGTIMMKGAKIALLQETRRFEVTERQGRARVYKMECSTDEELQEWKAILDRAAAARA